MRIALLTDGIHPYVIGGMQKHSFYLARELARNKHTVYLFHCNESNYDASKLEFFTPKEREHIKAFLIPFPHKKYFPLHYIAESKEYAQAIYNALQPLLAETDFIFAQGFCAWALLNNKAHNKFPPIAVHFHGLEMFQDIPSFKVKISRVFLQAAVKKNLHNCDYTISFGGKITSILEKIVPARKIWEIPGGIEKYWLVDAPPPLSDKLRFVFVGRYERRKGIPELNEAIHLLANQTFLFDFIGNIPDENKINHPSIRYHNSISSESEIKRILSGCDVIVCPSYAEGMPNVIMEGMANGLAVIATSVGAVPSLVNTENGWLIERPSPKNICEAMLQAIKDKDIQAKKSTSLSKIREGFLLEDVTNKLIHHIQHCINQNPVK